MKIGIISEYSNDTVNYGNHLQAYALNHVIRNMSPENEVQSIFLGEDLMHVTKPFSLRFLRVVYKNVQAALKKSKDISQEQMRYFESRKKRFEDFRNKYIPSVASAINGLEICNTDYDIFVVGSDVVWLQRRVMASRIKFLDFSTQKKFKRISYAASFGHDYIPEENKHYVRDCLNRFDAVSVREHSSVALLDDIGVHNAQYCLDPTLLMTSDEWTRLESKPSSVDENQPYAFVYLLGDDKQQRQRISSLCAEKGWKIVTIPFAKGVYFPTDEVFGNILLPDCSIENWIWLIHNAEYVFTDSFHCVAFATIFCRPFIVLKRDESVDINNRLIDYLKELDQTDKALVAVSQQQIDLLRWDFPKISAEIEVRRKDSIAFLRSALDELNE